MSLKDIATTGMTIHFDNSSGPPDLVPATPPGKDIAVSLAGVTYTEATKCIAVGNGICTNQLAFAWLIDPIGPPPVNIPCPFTSATHTFVSGGGSIAATATKVKAETQLVMRKEDVGLCAGTWTPPSGPNIACACTLEITNAGQTKVVAQ